MNSRLAILAPLLFALVPATGLLAQEDRIRRVDPRILEQVQDAPTDEAVPPPPSALTETAKRQFLERLVAQPGQEPVSGHDRLREMLTTQRLVLGDPDLRLTVRSPFSETPIRAGLGFKDAYQVLAYEDPEGYASPGKPADVWVHLYPSSPEPELYVVDFSLQGSGEFWLHPYSGCLVNFVQPFTQGQKMRLGFGQNHFTAVVQTTGSGPCRLTLKKSSDEREAWYFYSFEATRLD